MLVRAVVGEKNPLLQCELIDVKHAYQQRKLGSDVVKSLTFLITAPYCEFVCRDRFISS